MAFMSRTREVRMDPAQMLPGARSALVALVPYAGVPGPIARYAQWSDYHTELKSMSQGQGNFTMEFSHYDPVPHAVQQQLEADFKPKEDV